MPAPIADSVSVPAGTTLVRGGFAGIDTTPPTWGGATLQLSNLTSTSYTVTASAGATDDTAVAGYEYSLNGGTTWIANGTSLVANISGRTPGSTDAFRYRAFDAAGNRSALLALAVALVSSGPWSPVKALLQAASENSWIKLNLNFFSTAWPDVDYQPMMDSGRISSPGAIIVAWSSFALDDANGRIILFGGGHANTSDNSPYLWNASTRRWSQGFLPTDNVFSAVSGLWHNVESWQASPASAHTYGNNAYLPVLNRFITFGGAAWNTGHAYFVTDSQGAEIRPLPCYTLDLTLAGLGYVGGSTGSNVKRNSTAGLNLTGANAWGPRDYLLDHPSTTATNFLRGHLEGFVAYRKENNHDVLYARCNPNVGGSADTLVRIEFVNNDYHNDLISIVGTGAGSFHSDQGGALDSVNNVVLACGYPAQPIECWNLNTAGPANAIVNVPAADVGGAGKASYLAAMAAHFATRPQSSGMGVLFDVERARFVMWGGLAQLWTTSTPSNLSTGWTIEQLPAAVSDPPQYTTETGVHGKWKYSAAMDCYIGVVNASNGDVWAYKPANWNPKG